ncbi:MAG: signal peptidase I [Fidelibacterota bacterium]
MKTLIKILKEIRSLFIIILIALSLRATLVEAYIVPTGSMETTIRTGDFLIGNKFVYGMRTPDWVGIPYTDIGYDIPWIRFPSFKSPQRGDVVIFKYPRDVFQKYVKRLIALPGDTFEMKNDKVFINGEPEGKRELLYHKLNRNDHRNYSYYKITLNNGEEYIIRQKEGAIGGIHSYDPVTIPYKGQVLQIDENTNWDLLIPILLMDGHEVTYDNAGLLQLFNSLKVNSLGTKDYHFTMDEPVDIARRYESSLGLKFRRLFSSRASNKEKVQETNSHFRLYRGVMRNHFGAERMQVGLSNEGDLLNSWLLSEFINIDPQFIKIDGKPVTKMNHYVVEQNYFWMMGDNRDDSADSRYWGFVPECHVLGEAVFVYMSWDFNKGTPRLNRIGKVIN